MQAGIKLIPFFLLFFLLVLYIHNLSRDIYGGDIGDLVTAASVAGVPHAPGYPLFTFLGFLVTRFQGLATPAFLVGLISACAGALGILFLFLLIKRLTKNTMVSVISSLILAFSYWFWLYSELAEVFILNSFFAILLLYLSLRIRETPSTKLFLLFSFVLGLSLTHHQTITLIFPTLLLIVLKQLKILWKDKRLLLGCFVAGLVGLSVYLYVPIAASHNPIINTNSVHDLDSFLHLVLRKDYGTFNAGPFVSSIPMERMIALKVYLFDVVSQLTFPVILLSIIGIGALYKKDQWLCISFLTGFLITGPIFTTYAGFPLSNAFLIGVSERFYILSTIFIIIFFPFGLLYLTQKLGSFFHNKYYTLWFQAIFLLIPCLLFFYNFPKTDLSQIHIGDNLGYDLLKSLPQNAVLLIEGDTGVYNTWYIHYAKGYRKDIDVVNINNFVGNSYFRSQVDRYKKVVRNGSTADRMAIIITKINQNRPVFSHIKIQTKNYPLPWIPYGLVYKLLLPNQKPPSEPEFTLMTHTVWNSIQTPYKSLRNKSAFGNITISDIPPYYSDALLVTGSYFLSTYHNDSMAQEFFTKAMDVDPAYYKNYEVWGGYYLSNHQCNPAAKYFIKTIELRPYEKIAYFLLYSAYHECSHNNTASKQVVVEYQKYFNDSFFKELKSQMKDIKIAL